MSLTTSQYNTEQDGVTQEGGSPLSTSQYEAPTEAAEQSEEFFEYDNGVDPILRAPFPPVNFQVFITPNAAGPKLMWNVPDLLIQVQENFEIENPVALVQIANYDSGDTIASQEGTTVTLSGGGLRFTSTVLDGGRKIYWGPLSPNTSEIATVVTVLSPTTATVAETQTVAAGQFVYLTPGIVFRLYTDDEGDGVFVERADSEGSNTNGFIYQLHSFGLAFPDVLNPLWYHLPADDFTVSDAYITATENGVVVFSPTFLIHYVPT
jgi:hypothetical protein